MRLPELSRRFIIVRALEFAWILTIFVCVSAVSHFLFRPVGEIWGLGEALYASVIMLAWYYIGFQYLLISAVVMVTGWLTGFVKTPFRFALFNVLSFVLHSLIVMLVLLPGKVPSVLWVTWLFTIVFDAAISAFIVNLRRSKPKDA